MKSMTTLRNSYGDLFIADCRLRDAAQVFGHKWDPLVLAVLAEGPLRREVLHRSLGTISDKSLTETLNRLTAQELVIRTRRLSAPPRVDYALSDRGQSFVDGPLEALAEWTIETC